MPTLRRPTFTLHYDDLGPQGAPVVVLMSSLLCDRSMFGHLAGALAGRWRVLNVDLRGHGRSSAPSASYTLEDQADDIAALLDQVGAPSAQLVGLSQGGMTALRMAIYHPRRVHAMVIMSSSAEPEGAFGRWKYLAMAAVTRVLGVTPPIAAQVERLMFSDGFRRARPEVVAELVAAMSALDTLGIYRATQAVATRRDVSFLLPEVSAPTLVVAAGEDRALPPERSRRIAMDIPGAELVVVPGVGHLSTLEAPEETTRIVSAFLERHR